MDDYLENGELETEVEQSPEELEESGYIDFDALLKSDDFDEISTKLMSGIFSEVDFMKKDTIDRLLDFIYFKIQTGYVHIINMAYPTKRMLDAELERKVITILNEYLYPEIIFRLLKFFTRNIHDPDTNLYITYLINSDELITSIFETFKLFKKDIFKSDEKQRTLNVKRIQQFSSRSELKLSSPLDNSAMLKYILEFIAIKQDVSHIYTLNDIMLSKPNV